MYVSLSLDDEHKFMQYAIYHCSIVLPKQEYRMVDNMLKWGYCVHSEYEKHKFDESETVTGQVKAPRRGSKNSSLHSR